MPKIFLDSNEKRFLFDSLSKMENELRKMDSSLPTEQQIEFLEVVHSVFKERGYNPYRTLFAKGNVISPETLKHPKEIMEICMEFAFLYYAELKNNCRDEYFKRFEFLFDQFTVSRKDYKELLQKTEDRLGTEGPNSFIQKYKDTLRTEEVQLSQHIKEKLESMDLNGVPYDVVSNAICFCIANKRENTEWVHLPVANFYCYYGNTNFSKKWLSKIPDTILERELFSGVSRVKLKV